MTQKSQKDFLDKYDQFKKNENLNINTLPALLVSCGFMPPNDLKKQIFDITKKEPKETDNINSEDFLSLIEKCHPFKQSEELLKHLLFFTNNEVVIKKEIFEKMMNNGLSRNEFDNLYTMLNMKEDKINLEELVHCIVDEN